MIEHLETIVFPYLERKKEELGCIYDVFRGQVTQRVLDLIESNHCVNVYVPPDLTHIFQVLDLWINGHAKQFLNGKFSQWYTEQITKQLDRGVDIYNVKIDTTLTVMKPIHAQWLIGLYDNLRNSRDIIIKGFEQAGISEAIRQDLECEDTFADLD